MFFMSPQGTVLSHKRKVQGKANALCGFALVICAACVCRGVVEVVALLNADVAAFIRLSTPASEVSEESVIGPRYLNSFVKSTKPAAEPYAMRMSKRGVSTLE